MDKVNFELLNIFLLRPTHGRRISPIKRAWIHFNSFKISSHDVMASSMSENRFRCGVW